MSGKRCRVHEAAECSSDEIDARLWYGASIEGWTIVRKATNKGRIIMVYIAPSGAQFTCKSAAEAAAEDGGENALREQLSAPQTAGDATAATDALKQASAEGLCLMRSKKSRTGFANVTFSRSYGTKPFKAEVKVKGRSVRLGTFASAEEAALCCARHARLKGSRASRDDASGASSAGHQSRGGRGPSRRKSVVGLSCSSQDCPPS